MVPNVWRQSSKMEVKFLGVRGSTATPGNEFSKFGGNTSCTEIIHNDFQVILDAGTGFTDITIKKDVPVLVLFSHFHFDTSLDLLAWF